MSLMNQDIPALNGWITLSEAAEILGLSRQGMHRKARDQELKSLHRIGNRSIYVVSQVEVEELLATRRRKESNESV